MPLQDKIKEFHHEIGLRYETGKKEDLLDHGIQVTNLFDPRKISLKVRNFHYKILSCEVYYPKPTVTTQIHWESLSDRESFYLLSEMKQLALQVMYFLNLPLGECIIQRTGKKSISVYAVKECSIHVLSSIEEEKIYSLIDQSRKTRYLSFGSDVEVLIRNMLTKKWVNIASFVRKEGAIGYDDAIALHNHRVTHPILEVRPKYAYSGEELHGHLLREYLRLEHFLSDRHLEAVSGSNPLGRYLLGGHFHFGNQPLTYKHVQVLDQYLALPYALLPDHGELVRRKQFGRLGNVRENLFQGFEYRTLPSWYHQIPSMLPLLNWLEYLSRYSADFPSTHIPKKYIKAYYEGEHDQLYKWYSKVKQQTKDVFEPKAYERVAVPFFQWIEDQLKK